MRLFRKRPMPRHATRRPRARILWRGVYLVTNVGLALGLLMVVQAPAAIVVSGPR